MIAQQLNEQLKEAMRAKDQRLLGVIRMVKAKMTERKTSKGFKGVEDDALWLDVIGAYQKMQVKALAQYEALGEVGAEAAAELRWEIAWLEGYLPKLADEAQTRAWVEAAIQGLGGPDKARVGQVMGAVMKSHKGEVDANLVRDLVNAQLNG
ncbi:GatB/YqeY domain-containing protein [Myxococcota bacterium]|nr:GatB/YqeY domain-containing protein [Myxococcota bacterium]MBU1430470.1 GatB/YqeY domain-containing protein [Myxococcota bacterium]MBU1898826.1 GatB/YqeY domain-containing protein [Myxococcota bacterium]